MDLGAYVQIEDLEPLLKANGISIPRLRGLRLMSEQKPYTKDEMDEELKFAFLAECEEALSVQPAYSYNPAYVEYSDETRKRCRKYLKLADNGSVIGVRWDKLHGKKRKFIKYRTRKAVKERKQQIAMWNKYAGREDVLYIHARIGSNNWSGYHWSDFANEPWFLDAINDQFDNTYCDIYAKIDKRVG